jgi:hypothetical protein
VSPSGGWSGTAVNGVVSKVFTGAHHGNVKLVARAPGLTDSQTIAFQVNGTCAAGAVAVPAPPSTDGFGDAPFGVAAAALIALVGLAVAANRRRIRLA